ncbi:MAG TPA: cytochrome c biogenesis protein CcsA [Saprospiraceae bacterium]|nr:cytochrome c biogenesis protein CcsA [Saprospiraceae bacterium]
MKIQDLSKWGKALVSERAAGMYMLLFAIAIGVATFVENDFGTSSAQHVIFRSRWFEILLALFGATILFNIYKYRLIPLRKWASLSFHASIIIILIGAGVTRYFGYEGMMHIREGETANSFVSTEQYLQFRVIKNGKSYSFDEPVYFSSLGNNAFSKAYQIGSDLIKVDLQSFMPNPVESAVDDPNGQPMIKVVIGGMGGREEHYVKYGDKVLVNGIRFNFTNTPEEGAFNVFLQGDSLMFQTGVPVTQMVMATQQNDTLQPGTHMLMLRSLYTMGGSNFVVGSYTPKGKVTLSSGDAKVKSESATGLNLNIDVNGQSQPAFVIGRQGVIGRPAELLYKDLQLAVSYGSKIKTVPFSIKCRDFILERYPGTDNPSSYASEVTLIDPANGVNRDQRIYMNHILDYGGYRFFQSSFDQDELGTYLSVNHDFWGTWISYIGYIILTIGLMMTFFSKTSRFTYLSKKLREMQSNSHLVFILLLMLPFASNAQAVISADHASKFGSIVVQDNNGRFKPMNTLCGEIMRKVAKTESIDGLSPEQMMLSMMNAPMEWERKPFIHIGTHPQVAQMLGTTEKRVAYAQFFGADGQYIFKDQIRKAQTMNPKDHGTFEKTIIKLDEKVNITSMVFSGRLFKLFPMPNDPSNTWLSPADIFQNQGADVRTESQRTLFMEYLQNLSQGAQSGNYGAADASLAKITNFQKTNAAAVYPSDSKIKAELLLNKLDVFGRLRNYYGLLALGILAMFFYTVLKTSANRERWSNVAFYAVIAGFAFHTIGLGLRWYISGRAPWSNGYESMIYIGWTTTLAGILFSKRSLGGLAATMTLAATILLVAGMSWLDPEITPLVPVLKSYWLTIHVSLEAGSYGFLMLGAVIGMLNLILMVFTTDKNMAYTTRAVRELSIISEITLLGGLFMVAIGTYLGGVWANESWGRYWGWDAKETWALVTILVYSFILHMRFIPGLKSLYAFNFASLFGFATVIMTYFGVNYYLSGLHSYAAGDPVPIPSQVYYTAISLTILSIAAFIRYRSKFSNGLYL